MKRTFILVAFATALAGAANAQQFVTETPSSIGFLPKVFSYGNQSRLFDVWWDGSSTVQYSIYNNTLVREHTVSITLPTYHYLYTGHLDTIFPVAPYKLVLQYDNGNCPNIWFPVTQTLFNADNKYEYMMPILDIVTEPYYYSQNDNGTTTKAYVKGFKIINEDGEEVSRFYLQDTSSHSYYDGSYTKEYIENWGGSPYRANYNYSMSIYVCQIDNYRYLRHEAADGHHYWYRIDTQTQQIVPVETELQFNVFPTMVEQGDEVTIRFDGEGENATLTVVNSVGQTVKRIAVGKGQREVKLSTADLKGMNIINIGSPECIGSKKIVVN